MTPHDARYDVAGAHGTIAPQIDEGHLDDRSDADDDVEKGRIRFPNRLYGRDRELEVLQNIYEGLIHGACTDSEDEGEGGEQLNGKEVGEGQSAGPQSPLSNPYAGSRVVFLSGYSGVGKSALIKEFVQRCQRKHGASGTPILHASGKYTEKRSATTPFSAIGEALESLAMRLLRERLAQSGDAKGIEKSSAHEMCASVRSRIRESELVGPGTEGNPILRGTFPGLAPLLDGPEEDESRRSNQSRDELERATLGDELRDSSAAHPSMTAIKECTREVLSIICGCLKLPLIVFLDDLQWGDEASMDLLGYLLSGHGLCNIMFICAYRSNEVDEEHAFATLMENISKARTGEGSSLPDTVTTMDLFSLPPEAIAHFIADCVKKDEPGDVAELAEVVYQKTMGNIFFVRQALEELVRKNVLFYDLMCFEWRWVVSKVELGNYLSDDVVETVTGKIRELSADIQYLLIVMAYVPNTLSVALLDALMNNGAQAYDQDQIRDLLKEASEEGMLLFSVESGNYVLAHDRIREASIEFASEKNQDDLLLHISDVLLNQAWDPEMEWCLFAAADLLYGLPPDKTDHVDLAKLSLRVAGIARRKGASLKEHELLLKALKSLETSGFVWKDYTLTYEIYSALIVSEYSLGSYDKARLAIEEVLNHAKTLDEKLVAHEHRMLCKADESRDYAQGVEEGVKILNLYGYNIPNSPTKACMMKEEAKLKVAMRNRRYSCLCDLPVVDVPILVLFTHVEKYAFFSSKDNILRILAWKAIECSLKYGIDRNFPRILALLGGSLAKEGKVKASYEVGNVALALAEKIQDDKEKCAFARMTCYSAVVCQIQPFRTTIEGLHQCYKDLKLAGSPEIALGSFLSYCLSYFAAGLELGPILDSKLYLVEGYCRDVDRMSFLVTFQMCHQFALNLRKRSERPTELEGEAFHETEILNAMSGPGRKMALRDSSSYRLQLAFVFWDEATMAEMLRRLESYPLTDVIVARLHNRLCFTGLAAIALGRSQGNASFQKLGSQCMSYFAHLSKQGSVNARPVHLFMLALKKPNREAFQEAIDACAEAKFVHLEAMAAERYASLLKNENDMSMANDFLATAYWRYRDWGADAKASSLVEEHEFLKHCKRRSAIDIASDASERVKASKQGNTLTASIRNSLMGRRKVLTDKASGTE
ncbi:hypothetical protein ACHAXT_007984 [Thalassiosira profunda]